MQNTSKTFSNGKIYTKVRAKVIYYKLFTGQICIIVKLETHDIYSDKNISKQYKVVSRTYQKRKYAHTW